MASALSVFQALYKTGDHLGDDFQLIPKTADDGFLNQSFAARNFQQRNTLLGAAAGNDEEVLAVVLGEPTVPLRDVGRNGQRCPVQLICEEVVSPWESLRQIRDLVDEVDGFLVDVKVLEHERHFAVPFEQVNRRPQVSNVFDSPVCR